MREISLAGGLDGRGSPNIGRRWQRVIQSIRVYLFFSALFRLVVLNNQPKSVCGGQTRV